jgi:glycosyltransferase involved in cell wall biosynthesis
LSAPAAPEEMNQPSNQSTPAPVMGCTIADPATLPQAVVLANSFLQFHPGAEFTILLLGLPDGPVTESGPILLGLHELGLAAGEEWRLPMLFESHELTLILRPTLLLALLKRGAVAVAYFEHSTLLFAPLSGTELPAGASAVVATETIENEFGDSGRSYIAVRPGAESSLRSWAEDMNKEAALTHPENQSRGPLLDELFATIPHELVTTPGFAVGYWNLDPDTFTTSARGYETGGRSLRSFDFRGYDPEKPHLLSKYQGLEPRILLSEHPALATLCDEYRDKVRQASAGRNHAAKRGPRFLPSGLRLDPRMQRVYGDELRKWRAGQGAEPPSPFGPEGEKGFLKWLNEPLGQTRESASRYMLAVRADRPDVENAFPDPLGADATSFRDWYLLFGVRELEIPPALVPLTTQPESAVPTNGLSLDDNVGPVNVAGYFRAELGLGVAARSLLSVLEAGGIPFNTISFDATANRQNYPFPERATGQVVSDTNIICVNPDQIAVFAEQTGPELRNGRYSIGVWFWEVEDFPRQFHGAFNYVDEIWVASDFMRDAFLKVSPKPVFKFRLPVLTPQVDPVLSRPDLGLPDNFVFLFSFDFLSVLERKNPLGLIQAFLTAFPDEEGASLVIKTINGDKRILEMEKLRRASRGRSDIILLDGYLSSIENNTLTALSDCYVSLHRSEGFGLTIAEAMALARPVIATGYSGNLEFMTAENSYLCPARRSKVGPEREPYPADTFWSEPDLDAAAKLLRQVFEHREDAARLARRGAEDIRSLHSPAACVSIIRDRLVTIRGRRARAISPSTAWLEDRIAELEKENARLRGDT